MTPKHTNKYIFLIMGLLIFFAIYLQYSLGKSTEKLKNLEVKKAEQYAYKIAKYIQSESDGSLKYYLEKDSQNRDHLNKMLHAFLTKEFQYIFLLKKDAKGHYRFLLDGSVEDPVEYNTIFFPKSKLFNRVYDTQEAQIIEQSEGVEEVWLSLLYPMVEQNQTQALLVIDLSKAYGDYLNDFNSPIVYIVILMQLFLLVSFFFLAYVTYSFYKLRKSILVDPLTSAHTKVYLQEFFNKNRVDEYNAILIDIDEFKQINTKYGYEFGDIVLKEFVQVILEVLCSKSKIIRIGGTEFLVIVPKNEIGIEQLAKKLFKILKEKKYLIKNEVTSFTVSMSAVVIPKNTSSIQDIQRLLDEKLLEVKSRGKNNLAILGLKHLDEVKYGNIDYIREALEEERLLCLYQPIFNTRTKEIVKYEALARLIDKEDQEKLIAPLHFMKRIKGTSQYIKMSKLVLKDVFTTLHTYPNVELSVNLDLDDLYNNDMMKLITEELYKNRKIANRLTFEILEDHEIQDYDRVMLIFQQLKAFGSKIAIDDFGSGYANYVYLIKLDIDILKIDGSLIRELHVVPERAKVVLAAIKELASTFEYELVAEFVSDEEIYQIVEALGIEYSQGYYLGEPKPIEEYLEKKDIQIKALEAMKELISLGSGDFSPT
ncbi:MAG: bifunctional diguanylate cyclase/phosphodiesterase [Sulfurovum sp.]|nr:MAG: bifunctional diguanylate cyclase/phosphodiesterase [Sulfurovum sp.]